MKRRAEHATNQRVGTSSAPVSSCSAVHTALLSITYEDSFVPVQKLASTPVRCFHPARIDIPDDDGESLNERDADLETVVMLCNFGLSYYLMSTIHPDSSRRSSLLHNARSLLALASDVIAKRFADCETEIDEVRILSVALLVTSNLIHVAGGDNKDACETRRYEEQYMHIQEALARYHQVAEVWFGSKSRVSAPAT